MSPLQNDMSASRIKRCRLSESPYTPLQTYPFAMTTIYNL